MKPWKLQQITRIRAAVTHLRRDPHLQLCDCCREDLDVIEEYADSACAEAWLKQLARKIELSRSGRWRPGGSDPQP